MGIAFWIVVIISLGFLVIFAGTLLKILNMTNQNNNANNTATPDITVSTSSEETVSSSADSSNKVNVIMQTSMGDISLELYSDKAPNTVANFVKLAKSGFYDGTRFHRVIKDFMIQGGDPLSKLVDNKSMWGTGGPGYTFKDEFNDVKLTAGVLAMANAGPDTNGSQFFIVTADATPWLDGKHTPFGRVTAGMDVVRKIEDTPVDHQNGDKPVADVTISKIIVQ